MMLLRCFLILLALRAYNCAIEDHDVALKKPTFASSVYQGHGPDRLVDGNEDAQYNDNSCAHTQKNQDPWFMVDLEDDFKVDSVVIVNRAGSVHTRTNHINIGLANFDDNTVKPSLDPLNYDVCEFIKGPLGDGERREIDCTHMNGTYSHVIIQLKIHEYLHLCELEVYSDGIDLQCTQTNVAIEINTQYFSDIDFNDLHIGSDGTAMGCKLEEKAGNMMTANIPLESCGVIITSDVNNLNYLYEISAASYSSDEVGITREELLGISVTCSFKRTGEVMAQYSAMTTVAKYSATEFGYLVFTIMLYKDPELTKFVQGPVVLNSKIYVLIKLTAALKLNMFVRSCKATPNKEGSTQEYDLIEDGCIVDSTTKAVDSYTAHSTEYAFQFSAFKFKASGLNEVYLTCDVVVCTQDSEEAICAKPEVCATAKRSLAADDNKSATDDSSSTSETFTIQLGPLKVT